MTLLPLAPLFVLAAVPSTALADGTDTDTDTEALVRRGRELLAEGKADEAEAVLARADESSGGARDARTWRVRAWIDQGRIDAALEAAEDLEDSGQGPETDYLYGMAFFARAKQQVASGRTDSTTAFAFQDAAHSLERATAASGEFGDAWLPLAEAAWLSQDLDLASRAAEAARERAPDDAGTALLLGRVRFSQYSALRQAGTDGEGSREVWSGVIEAFQHAAQLAERATPPDAARASDAHYQLANAYLWEQRRDEAKDAYAEAIAWDPTLQAQGGDTYRQLFEGLRTEEGLEDVVTTLEKGERRFVERSGGAPTSSDATTLWWLGYAQYLAGDYEAAEEHLLAAVHEWPTYLNAWFYVGLARYQREDYAGAVEAWREEWQGDPDDVVASVLQDPELHKGILGYVVGWAAREGHALDAGFVSEILARTEPDNWEPWNNVGLFYRDAGEKLVKGTDADKERAQDAFERSYRAYRKAMELAPDMPHLKNDAAVVLDYYLDRELDEAQRLYEAAKAQAREQLDRGELEPDARELVQTALRDSTNNLARLLARTK